MGTPRLVLQISAVSLGSILVTYAWFLAYPLELRSTSAFLFSGIPAVYWLGFTVLALASADLGINGKSKACQWFGSICFFTTLFSLSYFYHTLPGSDPQFRLFVKEFFRSGSFDPNSWPASFYPWPGFFMLFRILLIIPQMSQTVSEFVLYFVTGVVLTSVVFGICDRAGMKPFFGVVVYAITGYYFIDYQFAAQAVALVFLMTMLLAESKFASGFGKTAVTAIMFVAATCAHAFLQLFYLVYLAVRSFRGNLMKIAILGTIFLAFNMYYTIPGFSKTVSLIYGSISEILGISEYQAVVATTTASNVDLAFQQLSRAAVLLAGGVSLFGLVKGWRRELTRFDKSLVVTVVVLAVLGSIVWLVGTRGTQLGFVALAIGAAFFPKRSRFQWKTIMVIVIVVLSISLPMHMNFDRYQYQPGYTRDAFGFMVRHLPNQGRPLGVFVPHSFGFEVQILRMDYDSEVGVRLAFGLSPLYKVDYALTTVQTDHYLMIRSEPYPEAVVRSLEHGNRMYDNGFARLTG